MVEMIELAVAERLVLDHAHVCPDVESVALDASLGRRLAVDLACPTPWPTTDRSAMDGFALGATLDGAPWPAGATFTVVGQALAGHPFDGVVAAGQAVRIMTGGVVPAGADRVAKVEDTSGFDGARMTLGATVGPGENVRPCGSEIAAGTVVLRAGTRIRSAEIGALAVLGCVTVPVVRRPRVVIVATGDEVVDVTAEPALHQVRDSNSWALAAKVVEAGGLAERVGIVADAADVLRVTLDRALAGADVVLTIGGVSEGTHDLVHGTLAALGVRTVFHGVRLKPGKPTLFGTFERAGRRGAVFGLPGNPASAFTTFDLFVRPLLERFGGGVPTAPLQVRVGGAPCRRNPRTQAIPAGLATDADGRAIATLAVVRPSGDPFGLLGADGYGIVPAGAEPASLGTIPFVRGTGGDA